VTPASLTPAASASTEDQNTSRRPTATLATNGSGITLSWVNTRTNHRFAYTPTMPRILLGLGLASSVATTLALPSSTLPLCD
jgi:hypothetical protein